MTRPIHVYTYAPVAFDDAIALLADDPRGLLREATAASEEHAETVVGHLHVDVGEFDVGRDVQIELGAFNPVEALRSVVPVRWRASHGHVWFPTMDATLEISALSLHPPRVQVTLTGAYKPPLGPLGAVIDAVVAHRVAEATTHTFVNEVAERLQQLAGELPDEHTPLAG